MVDVSETGSRFQTTSWTLVINAPGRRESLGRLLEIYWAPVYAYLRRHGQSAAAAADLTQGFLTRLIEKDLISRADPQRGRFRSFLLSSLDNYVIDEIRAEVGREGKRPDTTVCADPDAHRRVEPAEDDDPARAFSRQWATTIMQLALERLEADCRERGLEVHWGLFEAQVLNPSLHNCEPVPAEELARRVGVRDREDVYNMVHTVKKKFHKVLREVVADTVEDPADLDDEVAQVLGCLGQ